MYRLAVFVPVDWAKNAKQLMVDQLVGSRGGRDSGCAVVVVSLLLLLLFFFFCVPQLDLWGSPFWVRYVTGLKKKIQPLR